MLVFVVPVLVSVDFCIVDVVANAAVVVLLLVSGSTRLLNVVLVIVVAV